MKHVLITGHTGFKGSWLIAMLNSRGIKVSGIALEPANGGFFERADLHKLLVHDFRLDIRDSIDLIKAFQKISPDVVIHLAAQPIVLASYNKPLETYETNVMGTLNVLQAVEATPSIEATLIITTDKVYRQEPGDEKSFIESDPLGAADPYSTSKAMADLLTQSWISSNLKSRIAIARAGNVVGGGDVSENRIVPDLVRAFREGREAIVRNPNSIRPWQHVMDCLAGYIVLAEKLLAGDCDSGAFNFGPEPGLPLRVSEVASIAASEWGSQATWKIEDKDQPSESKHLLLDSSKSNSILNWSEKLSSREAIRWSTEWAMKVFEGEDALEVTLGQILRWSAIGHTSSPR